MSCGKTNSCFLSLPESIATEYKLSIYNLYLDEVSRTVYNTKTQAVCCFDDCMVKAADVDLMLENGFLVRGEEDELEDLKTEYDSREQFCDELHLILATTMDCQFRCFYCYEKHPHKYMNTEVKNAILNLVEQHAAKGHNISIVWYGGEPLLDFSTIRDMTLQFKTICKAHSVHYKASMISNGYLFNDEMISQLNDLCIESVQITVDGMREIHEKRRPMIDGNKSFERIIENIIKIHDNTDTRVHLRINVDKSNIDSAYDLLNYIAKLGLNDIDANLGMMKAFGCDHVCDPNSTLIFSMKEFSAEYLCFRDHAKELGFNVAISKMVPDYKINSCTMDAPNSYVIDAEGYVYKCISLVGQQERSIGNVLTRFNDNAHLLYSPFSNTMCRKCKYFPVCKGGCLLNNSENKKECNVWQYITEKLMLREIKESSSHNT